MQNNLVAKRNYPSNYNILLDYSIIDILIKSEKNNNSNIMLKRENNTIRFLTKKEIVKGDNLSLELSLNNEIQLGGGINSYKNFKMDLKNFVDIIYDFAKILEDGKICKYSIKNFKNKVNNTKFFRNNPIDNKFIYKMAKKIKKSKDQTGGTYNEDDGMTNYIEKLPDVKVGSFIHNPQSIPITKKIEKLHLLLDLIGIIPGYGLAADVINFILYFIRGEYADSFYSLICMIPTVGSLIGLSMKYLVKFIYNRNPEYRKYYDSLISLKQITTELRQVENKNVDLDNIAYKDDDQDFDP